MARLFTQDRALARGALIQSMDRLFRLKEEKSFGKVQARLFSYLGDRDNLYDYIKDGIRSSEHSFESILENYSGECIDKRWILEQYRKNATPKDHPKPAFDVKRSTVTEFMAEFLLEKQFQCIFYEAINKKKTKTPIDADKHTAGIDVLGMKDTNEGLKFVVAEVKASEDEKIPCRAAGDLKQDIEKILDPDSRRLIKEALYAFGELRPAGQKSNEAQVDRCIKILLKLINTKDSRTAFIENVIVFPFLIRNHPDILKNKNLDDFKNFSELDTKDAEVTGILWACNKSINDFVQEIYEEIDARL